MAEYKIELESPIGTEQSAVLEDKDEALEFLKEARIAQGVETATVMKRDNEASSWNTIFVHLPTAYAEVLLLTD